MSARKKAANSKSKAPAMTLDATCNVGPYQGFLGRAKYDADDGCYTGRLLGIEDVVTFVGETPEALAAAFRESVDDYLDFCRRHGREAHRSFSGQLMVRLPEEMHRQLSALAEARAMSLNSLVVDAIVAKIGMAR